MDAADRTPASAVSIGSRAATPVAGTVATTLFAVPFGVSVTLGVNIVLARMRAHHRTAEGGRDG